MNHKILELTDRLDNLKFAYALSEARIKQLEARVELLEEALNYALIRHCRNGVLGPDSRCTPDWFVELSAVQCSIQKTELKCQLDEISNKPTTSNDPASSTAYDDQFLPSKQS